MWEKFFQILDDILYKYLNRNIVLYGANESMEFIKYFIMKRYNKKKIC